jgi:hypothetical protein
MLFVIQKETFNALLHRMQTAKRNSNGGQKNKESGKNQSSRSEDSFAYEHKVRVSFRAMRVGSYRIVQIFQALYKSGCTFFVENLGFLFLLQ